MILLVAQAAEAAAALPRVALTATQHAAALLPADVPNPAPDAGAPGASAFVKLIGVLKFYGLLAGFAGVLISAMVFGVGRYLGNHHAAMFGRIGLFAALAGAIIVGGGSTLIDWAFNLGAHA